MADVNDKAEPPEEMSLGKTRICGNGWRQALARPIALLAVVFVAGGLLSACASTSEPVAEGAAADDYSDDYAINDPYEDLNRSIFAFNQAVDSAILRPAAEAYALIPEWGRNRVSSALDNLGEPINFANNLLQGEMERAAGSFLRFAFNSTIGIAGLFDVAGELGMEYVPEDFGQTAAVWGAGEGPYLVLPLIGPSNPRDAFGMAVDWLMGPFTYALRSNEKVIRSVARGVEQRAEHLETLDVLKDTSVDFYAAMRELYRQHRDDEIRNGALPPPIPIPSLTIEDYEDDLDEAPEFAADEDKVASNQIDD